MSATTRKDATQPAPANEPAAASREALRRELLKRIVASENQRRDQRKGS